MENSHFILSNAKLHFPVLEVPQTLTQLPFRSNYSEKVQALEVYPNQPTKRWPMSRQITLSKTTHRAQEMTRGAAK